MKNKLIIYYKYIQTNTNTYNNTKHITKLNLKLQQLLNVE